MAVQKLAEEAWRQKAHPALDEERVRAFLNRVQPYVEARDVPDGVDNPFTEQELLRALRQCYGSAPGPCQLQAEVLLAAPPEALGKDTAQWPDALRLQEVVPHS